MGGCSQFAEAPLSRRPDLRQPDLRRRQFVAAGICLVVSAAAPQLGLPDAAVRTLTLFNTHTGEELTAAYFAAGTYDPAVLQAIDKLLRDHRSGEIGHMDAPLFDYLYDVAARAAVAAHYEVISGFRSASSNELLRRSGGGGVAEKSLHLQGKAIDVRLRGVATDRLRDIALALKRGGVGYYPKSNFVHLDTGRVRRWEGK